MVRDPAAHRQLWVDLFGAPVVSSGTLELIKLPGVFLIFGEGARAEGSEGSVLDHVAFRVRDLAATSAKLKAAGIPLTRDDSLEIVASFPDQLKIEFYCERHGRARHVVQLPPDRRGAEASRGRPARRTARANRASSRA
jgi:catechol 2,3-dioxygenase-like lactoylglutathione lyase family enzyme